VSYTDLLLDPYEKAAGLQRVGQSIDLGVKEKGENVIGSLFLALAKLQLSGACLYSS